MLQMSMFERYLADYLELEMVLRSLSERQRHGLVEAKIIRFRRINC